MTPDMMTRVLQSSRELTDLNFDCAIYISEHPAVFHKQVTLSTKRAWRILIDICPNPRSRISALWVLGGKYLKTYSPSFKAHYRASLLNQGHTASEIHGDGDANITESWEYVIFCCGHLDILTRQIADCKVVMAV